MDTIGTRLKAMLKLKKMRQADLSEMSGISPTCVSRYVRDIGTPNAVMLGILAQTLDVSTDYLLGLIDRPVSLKDPNRGTIFAHSEVM